MIINGKQSKQSLTKTIVISLIVISCFIFYISFSSAEYSDCEVYGNCPSSVQPTYVINETLFNVNNSIYWDGHPFSYLTDNYYLKSNPFGFYNSTTLPVTNLSNYYNTTQSDSRYLMGTGVNGRISYWNATTTQTSDDRFLWNSTTNTLKIYTDNTEGQYALDSADKSIFLYGNHNIIGFGNPSGTAVTGGIRGDFGGNFNWHATGTQGHQFYNSLNPYTATAIVGIGNTGMIVGGTPGSVNSIGKLDVLGTIYTLAGLILNSAQTETINSTGDGYINYTASLGHNFNGDVFVYSKEGILTDYCTGLPDNSDCSQYESQENCELYTNHGSQCSWSSGESCEFFDEGTCLSYAPSCSTNYGDYCDAYDNTDESTCTTAGCSWSEPDCSGQPYFSSCSGTYGSGCSGTMTCEGQATQGETACESLTSCEFSQSLVGGYEGDVTANHFIGNGSLLTDLPTPDLSGYVPYTGATTAVDLNSQLLYTTGYISAWQDLTVGNPTSGSSLGNGVVGVSHYGSGWTEKEQYYFAIDSDTGNLYLEGWNEDLEYSDKIKFDSHLNISAPKIDVSGLTTTYSLNVTDGSTVHDMTVTGNFSAKRPYLNAYDNTTQNFLNTANTQIMNFSTIEDNYYITIEGKQNITFSQTGDYLCIVSPEFTTTATTAQITFWYQKTNSSGVFNDVAWTNSRFSITNNEYSAPAIPFQFDIENTTRDKVRFMWYSTSTNSKMEAITGLTSPTRPSIPSIILNCQKASEITP